MKGLNNDCKFFLFLGGAAILALLWLFIASSVGLAANACLSPNCPTPDVPPATSKPPATPDTPVPPVETEVPTEVSPPTDIPATDLPKATAIVPRPTNRARPSPEVTSSPGRNDKTHKHSPKPTATPVETLPVTGFAEASDLPWLLVLMPTLLGIAGIAGLIRRNRYGR